MPKFQSTVNPEEIIEVSEERASIFRSKTQTGWQEYFEDAVNDPSSTGKQSAGKTTRKRSVKRQSKRVQQADLGAGKPD